MAVKQSCSESESDNHTSRDVTACEPDDIVDPLVRQSLACALRSWLVRPCVWLPCLLSRICLQGSRNDEPLTSSCSREVQQDVQREEPQRQEALQQQGLEGLEALRKAELRWQEAQRKAVMRCLVASDQVSPCLHAVDHCVPPCGGSDGLHPGLCSRKSRSKP